MRVAEGIAALYLCSHCTVEGKSGISHSVSCWLLDAVFTDLLPMSAVLTGEMWQVW